MSLLADLLAKAKTEESQRDIPPDLRKAVVDGAVRRQARRKFIIISAVVLAIVLSGFGAIYVMESFRTSLARTVAQKSSAPENEDRTSVSSTRRAETMHSAVSPAQLPTGMEKPAVLMGSEKIAPRSEPRRIPVSPAGEPEETMRKKNPVSTTDAGPVGATAKRREISPMQKVELPKAGTGQDVYLYAARTHEARREYNLALSNYKKALELETSNYIVMNNIAGVLIRLGSFEESLRYSRNALDVKANHVPSLVNAGIARISLGDYGEGESFLLKALNLEPSNREAIFNLGVLREKQGEYDKAYEAYSQLAQVRDVNGCLGAARIMEKQGRNPEAVRLYREILSIETAGASAKAFAQERLTWLFR